MWLNRVFPRKVGIEGSCSRGNAKCVEARACPSDPARDEEKDEGLQEVGEDGRDKSRDR